MDEVGKLIIKRFEVADINRTNMVHFTPSDRHRIRNWIDECPAVVRCKDCKHYWENAHECTYLNQGCIKPDFFCGYGERKGDGDAEN